jgi:3-phenylpropionate/trans-cinnamate dioxygenase ferredoxin reductase component
VIAGGGLAAVRTAQALRSASFSGEIVLLSAERELPYDRPPLSKDFLLGKASEQDIRLISAEELGELEVRLELGRRATALDAARRRVATDDGEELEYESLVVATGASPVRLPIFGERAGVSYLHELDDARRLREELASRPRVGIVGGGFIGLEIAAVAIALGCEVTVVEATEDPLAPVLGAELGGWIRAWHEEHGVAFRCGSPVAEVLGEPRIERLLLADGGEIDADVAVVGVGVRPNVQWMQGAGVELHRGLVCDSDGRTSDPHVFGVGDATCRHGDDGACHPSAHWTAVGTQAVATAGAILGSAGGGQLADDGYFWSDQHGKRLQFTGTMPADPQLTLVAGGPQEGSFVVRCGSGGVDSAVLALANPRDFVRTSLELRRARAGAQAPGA